MVRRIEVKKGDVYNRLTIIKEVEAINKHRAFEVVCTCGTVKTVVLDHMRRGMTQSCGCLAKELTIAANKSRFENKKKQKENENEQK